MVEMDSTREAACLSEEQSRCFLIGWRSSRSTTCPALRVLRSLHALYPFVKLDRVVVLVSMAVFEYNSR
jgi:hypothetical protein